MSFKSKVITYVSALLIVLLLISISVTVPTLILRRRVDKLTKDYEGHVKSLEETISKQEDTIKFLQENTESLASELKKVSSFDIAVYSIPEGHNSFKSYMSYKTLSKNFKGRQIVDTGYTDEFGLRRVNGAYCVALGTYYGDVGDTFRLTLSTGVQVLVIKCDTKSDSHTDSSHRYTLKNNCMAEFLVDTSKLSRVISTTGNVSTGTELEGSIVSIVKEG